MSLLLVAMPGAPGSVLAHSSDVFGNLTFQPPPLNLILRQVSSKILREKMLQVRGAGAFDLFYKHVFVLRPGATRTGAQRPNATAPGAVMRIWPPSTMNLSAGSLKEVEFI